MPGSKSWDALVRWLTVPLPESSRSGDPFHRAAGSDRSTPDLHEDIQYLRETLPRLPNFFATRTTVSYGERPPGAS